MTALKEIKKPLEGRDIATLTNVELVTEISRLLGENERLRQFLFPYADRTDISGISWDGKYLIGDKASITAFHEMKNRGEQIDVYKRAYDQNEAALKARAEAAEAEVKRLQAEIDRTARNRDMWKGQVERQAAQIEDFRSETKRIQVGVYVETLPAVHLISVFADDMNERNWDDKRAYIKQQADRIRTALASTGGEHHAE